MKDRFLFKAKHSLNSKKWHIGSLIKEPDGMYIRDIHKEIMVYIQDESTICQCTGLRDWNNRLIWERDIVSVPSYLGKYLVEWQEDVAGFVMTEYGSTVIDFDNVWNYQVEVVGNIFDNWELLEVH